jgi:hypothetical protein
MLLPLQHEPQEALLRPQAFTLVTAMHVCFGLLLPGAYIYYSELCAREGFIQQLQGSHSWHSALSSSVLGQLALPPFLMGMSFLLMVMAVVWNVVSLFAPVWLKWVDGNPLSHIVDSLAVSHAAGACLQPR